jgi:hypothetical protein
VCFGCTEKTIGKLYPPFAIISYRFPPTVTSCHPPSFLTLPTIPLVLLLLLTVPCHLSPFPPSFGIPLPSIGVYPVSSGLLGTPCCLPLVPSCCLNQKKPIQNLEMAKGASVQDVKHWGVELEFMVSYRFFLLVQNFFVSGQGLRLLQEVI